MPPTVRTHDFRALHTERTVHVAGHGAGDGIEERRPAAAGLEFMGGAVERRVARGARIGPARRHVLVVGTCVRRFGTFFAQDAELFLKGIS